MTNRSAKWQVSTRVRPRSLPIELEKCFRLVLESLIANLSIDSNWSRFFFSIRYRIFSDFFYYIESYFCGHSRCQVHLNVAVHREKSGYEIEDLFVVLEEAHAINEVQVETGGNHEKTAKNQWHQRLPQHRDPLGSCCCHFLNLLLLFLLILF